MGPEYFTLYICADFDLKNQKTKRECKDYRYLQNCLTLFMKPDFRYWVSLRCFVLSFGLRAQIVDFIILKEHQNVNSL